MLPNHGGGQAADVASGTGAARRRRSVNAAGTCSSGSSSTSRRSSSRSPFTDSGLRRFGAHGLGWRPRSWSSSWDEPLPTRADSDARPAVQLQESSSGHDVRTDDVGEIVISAPAAALLRRLLASRYLLDDPAGLHAVVTMVDALAENPRPQTAFAFGDSRLRRLRCVRPLSSTGHGPSDERGSPQGSGQGRFVAAPVRLQGDLGELDGVLVPGFPRTRRDRSGGRPVLSGPVR